MDIHLRIVDVGHLAITLIRVRPTQFLPNWPFGTKLYDRVNPNLTLTLTLTLTLILTLNLTLTLTEIFVYEVLQLYLFSS